MELKNLRESKGLTQEDVAKIIGVTQQYISLLEKGNINGITLSRLNKMKKAFGVDECKLLKILRRDAKIFSKNNIK